MAELSKVKSDLIAEIEKRVEDHVLEPSNAELLTKLISQADNDNEALSIATLGTMYKKTGLHFDARLEPITTHDIRYFRKNEKLSFHTDNNKPVHKLIIGDNYEALQNLLVQYTGAIDVIYIDPPYGKDSMGEFAQTNYQNAITRDNLLSMLYPRLQLAKQLLSDSGVIFCSIDDKNQAYVKCLFDEVFGERNFVACVPRKTGAGDAATRSSTELRKPFDYLIIYKNSNTELQKKVVGEKEYKYSDEYGMYKLDKFQASGSDATKKARPNLYYPIYVLRDNTLSLTISEKCIKTILPQPINGEEGRWMWKPEKFDKDKDRYLFYDGKTIYRKTYFNEEDDQNIYQVEQAWIDGGEYRNAKGTTELAEIIGKNQFKNPKPIALVKWCINLLPKKENFIILDFFAGSGTTGHAVLDLNRSEEKEGDLFADTNIGGNRTFILCQMNEKTDTTPNGIAYDVTAKRLRRIMTGECYDGTKDFEWIKKNKPYGGNLDVYEIDKVADFEYTEGKSPFDVIDETLYGQPRFATLQEKIDWVCSHFGNARKQLD